jgi:uncharacterized membrane protein YkvA (DUF1232 family)
MSTDPESAVDELAREMRPEDGERLRRQFEGRLEAVGERLEPEVLAMLKVLWNLFEAPDEAVAWKERSLAMAALGYFASPVDLVPDVFGRAGYKDDAVVIKLVYARIGRTLDLEPYR